MYDLIMCINHAFYTSDPCLMAPGIIVLQEYIYIHVCVCVYILVCYGNCIEVDLNFNTLCPSHNCITNLCRLSIRPKGVYLVVITLSTVIVRSL